MTSNKRNRNVHVRRVSWDRIPLESCDRIPPESCDRIPPESCEEISKTHKKGWNGMWRKMDRSQVSGQNSFPSFLSTSSWVHLTLLFCIHHTSSLPKPGHILLYVFSWSFWTNTIHQNGTMHVVSYHMNHQRRKQQAKLTSFIVNPDSFKVFDNFCYTEILKLHLKTGKIFYNWNRWGRSLVGEL